MVASLTLTHASVATDAISALHSLADQYVKLTGKRARTALHLQTSKDELANYEAGAQVAIAADKQYTNDNQRKAALVLALASDNDYQRASRRAELRRGMIARLDAELRRVDILVTANRLQAELAVGVIERRD
jgi:hypothetical protein